MGRLPEEASASEQQIQLEPPGPQRLFRLEGEDALMERMRQEALERRTRERITFPDVPVLSRETYHGRCWPRRDMLVEPYYVCYGRLLFEQKNFERYGWDLGIVSAVVSPALFFKDVAALPYHKFKDPFRCCECSPGYCLPGDPVPLLLYPPELSATGTVAEIGAILAVVAIFP
jgi:hypothetical protein